MSEFVSCPVLTGEVLQETSHWNQRHYLPSSLRSSTTTDLRRPWIQSDRWLPSPAWAPFSSLWSPQLQIAGRFISGPNNSLRSIAHLWFPRRRARASWCRPRPSSYWGSPPPGPATLSCPAACCGSSRCPGWHRSWYLTQIHQFPARYQPERVSYFSNIVESGPPLQVTWSLRGTELGKYSFVTDTLVLIEPGGNGVRYLRCPTRFLRAMVGLVLFFSMRWVPMRTACSLSVWLTLPTRAQLYYSIHAQSISSKLCSTWIFRLLPPVFIIGKIQKFKTVVSTAKIGIISLWNNIFLLVQFCPYNVNTWRPWKRGKFL